MTMESGARAAAPVAAACPSLKCFVYVRVQRSSFTFWMIAASVVLPTDSVIHQDITPVFPGTLFALIAEAEVPVKVWEIALTVLNCMLPVSAGVTQELPGFGAQLLAGDLLPRGVVVVGGGLGPLLVIHKFLDLDLQVLDLLLLGAQRTFSTAAVTVPQLERRI